MATITIMGYNPEKGMYVNYGAWPSAAAPAPGAFVVPAAPPAPPAQPFVVPAAAPAPQPFAVPAAGPTDMTPPVPRGPAPAPFVVPAAAPAPGPFVVPAAPAAPAPPAPAQPQLPFNFPQWATQIPGAVYNQNTAPVFQGPKPAWQIIPAGGAISPLPNSVVWKF
ncbi:hypothetical protein BZA77DRAFT_348359 [Pyronema omphalodes]|nr:hypothetical protein BZA77DRAFT_348359 [Pyronema omphalodes]